MPKIPQEIWNGRTKNPRIFGTGVPIIGGADFPMTPGGPLFAAKIGPTPDHFWLPNLVRVAKSGPGLNETIPCPVKFIYIWFVYTCMVCYQI